MWLLRNHRKALPRGSRGMWRYYTVYAAGCNRGDLRPPLRSEAGHSAKDTAVTAVQKLTPPGEGLEMGDVVRLRRPTAKPFPA